MKSNFSGVKERGRKATISDDLEDINYKTVIESIDVSAPTLYNLFPTSWCGPACIVGGAMAHFTFGSLYCWGNFYSYAPISLRSNIVFPLTVVSQCLSMPWGPIITKKLGARITLLLGAWIMAAGVYSASYATDLNVFLFCYAVVVGFGIGIAYTSPMIAGWSWMPQSKGLISGAILTGFGLGGFCFNLVGSSIANPLGEDPVNGEFPHEVYDRFPSMLRRLSVMYACISLVGSLLISEPIKINSKEDNDKKNAGREALEVLGVTISEALSSSQFWLMWAMIITSASAGLNVVAIYKQFAALSPILKGDSYQALVGGMGALFNGFGRLFWGSISDRIGFKTSFTILTMCQALIQFLYPYCTSSKAFFLAINCLCYFCLAGNFAMMPPAIQRMFGSKNGALIYGLIYTAFGTAALATMLLSKAMLALTGWAGVFHLLASISIFATFLTTFLKPLSSLPSSTV